MIHELFLLQIRRYTLILPRKYIFRYMLLGFFFNPQVKIPARCRRRESAHTFCVSADHLLAARRRFRRRNVCLMVVRHGAACLNHLQPQFTVKGRVEADTRNTRNTVWTLGTQCEHSPEQVCCPAGRPGSPSDVDGPTLESTTEISYIFITTTIFIIIYYYDYY